MIIKAMNFPYYALNRSSIEDLPDIQALIDQYKSFCKSLGWRSPEYDDWIWSGADYHKFYWHHGLTAPLFSGFVQSKSVYIQEGSRLHLNEARCTAWIFKKKVPQEVFTQVVDDLDLLRRTAVYDLSPAYEGKLQCFKVNQTESIVFREFEEFLDVKYGIRFIELSPHLKTHKFLRREIAQTNKEVSSYRKIAEK